MLLETGLERFFFLRWEAVRVSPYSRRPSKEISESLRASSELEESDSESSLPLEAPGKDLWTDSRDFARLTLEVLLLVRLVSFSGEESRRICFVATSKESVLLDPLVLSRLHYFFFL